MRWHGATPVTGHAGLRRAWPSLYYPRTLHNLVGIHVELLALAAALVVVLLRRRRATDMIPVALALRCFAPVLFCRSNFPRYALPAAVFMTFLAAVGIVSIARSLQPRWRTAAMIAAVALCAALQIRVVVGCVDQFGDDSRDRLLAWMATHLPPGSTVAADTYAGPFVTFGGLQAIEAKPGVRVHAALSAADFGRIDQVRAAGYTHVAVSAAAFGRYFDPDLSPLPDHAAIYGQRRDWYRRLFDEQELTWSSDPSPDLLAYTNPPLRLYRLRESITPPHPGAVAAVPRSSRAAR
jgi:hypothetical protein